VQRQVKNKVVIDPKTRKHVKVSHKITTINDILTQDDVKTTLSKVSKEQAEITDLICIYQDREGYISWYITKDTTLDRKILLLEQVKTWLLTGEDE
jgi:hypothetical protein